MTPEKAKAARRKRALAAARAKWSGQSVKGRKVTSVKSIDGAIMAMLRCKSGHRTQAKIGRVNAIGRCPQCVASERERKIRVGKRFGTREIIAQDLLDASRVTTRCDCGSVSETSYRHLLNGSECRPCKYAARSVDAGANRGRPEVVAQLRSLVEEFPWMLDDTEESIQAVSMVVDLLGPLSVFEVGAFFGFSRQRASQVEFDAREKFKAALLRDEQRRQEHEEMGPFRRKLTDHTVWDVR